MELEPINWAAAKVLFDVLQAAFMGGMGVYIYWQNKHRASQSAIQQTNQRIDGVEKQVARLEHQVERLPDHSDLAQLREQMAASNLLLAEINTSQKATAQQVDRLSDYLLNRGGKA